MADGVLPAWLGDVLEIGEVVLDPRVDVFQGHALPLCAVDGELYHGHVGVWGSFRHRVRPGCRRSRGALHLRALGLTLLQVKILLFFHLLLDAAGAQPVGSHLSKPLDVGQAVVQGAAGCLTASTVLPSLPRKGSRWS